MRRRRPRLQASAAELEQPSVNQQAEPNVPALDDDGLTLWGEFGQTAEGQVAACETPVAVESCAECCAFEKVADADGSEGVIVSFMLDRGSNVVLFKDEAISQMAVVESNVPEDVVGVWQASASSIGSTLRARFLLG